MRRCSIAANSGRRITAQKQDEHADGIRTHSQGLLDSSKNSGVRMEPWLCADSTRGNKSRIGVPLFSYCHLFVPPRGKGPHCLQPPTSSRHDRLTSQHSNISIYPPLSRRKVWCHNLIGGRAEGDPGLVGRKKPKEFPENLGHSSKEIQRGG